MSIVRGLIAISCVAAISVSAQKTTTTKTTTTKTTATTTNTTDTTGSMSTETTAKTTAMKKKAPAGMSRTRVRSDAGRLAAILSDAQSKVNLSAEAWRVTANEANSLANHIYAASGGRSQARELRSHVQQMREAALKGDSEGARKHAAEALPYANQLIDWAK